MKVVSAYNLEQSAKSYQTLWRSSLMASRKV